MKISNTEIKKLLSCLNFCPENGKDGVYIKKYSSHSDYIIRVDFNTQQIIYRSESIQEEMGIKIGDATTSNFDHSENFVVLECVNRLLEKGYAPSAITLEKKYPLGRNLKGKLDIVVADLDGKTFLMIECKTWGTEYEKEYKKMLRDGAQFFSYFVNDRAAKFLCLYTSELNNNKVEYKNSIIPIEPDWSELANVKEVHDHWTKNFKDNGIFEEWATAYNVEVKALVRGRLQPLTKDESGRIFNQFAEILRHNVVSDKPNAFNKILNLFICKIIDEDKNDNEQVEFQWLEDDTYESLQIRLNDLYKKGMHRFLDIDVTDFSEKEISNTLININDSQAQKVIKEMFIKLRLNKNPEFAFIEVYDDTSFKLNARIVREVVELLQPYQFRYGHKQQFLGDFFELLLNTSIKQEVGQYFTPVPITRYIVSSLPIRDFIEQKLKSNDPNILPTVIDFACGTGHFLTEYMDKVQSIIENELDIQKAKPSAKKKLGIWKEYDKFAWAGEYVYGIDADYRLVKSAKVSSFLNGDGDANIIRANGLDSFEKSKEYKGKLKHTSSEDSKDNAQFDVLIANPPYSVNAFKSTIKYGMESFELFDKFTEKSSEIECLFIERMKQLLRPGGYAGIILPSSILRNSGIYTCAREVVLKYFNIVAITEFGSNTFMATNTNTVALFLKRRANTDLKQIQVAVKRFFDNPKEVAVLSIEKAFSKYVQHVYDGITIEDYISFINKKPSLAFTKQELYITYYNWFEKLNEVVKLKESKLFKNKSEEQQKADLEKLFYEKVFEIEKDKLTFFLLAYGQKTVITKVGDKQDEKSFLGYEFSNSRGHEGLKMLPTGTKLYDDEDQFNPDKANYYVYSAFNNEFPVISETLAQSITTLDLTALMEYGSATFEKTLNILATKKVVLDSKYPSVTLESIVDFQDGLWKGEKGELTRTKVLRNTNFKMNNGKISYDDIAEIDVERSCLSSRMLECGDILLEKSGGSPSQPVGRVVLFELNNNEVYSYSNFCTRLRVKSNEFNSKFLWLMLNEFYKLGGTIPIQNGVRLLNLKMPEYKSIKIPTPPKSTQDSIVNEISIIENNEIANAAKIEQYNSSINNEAWFSYETQRIESLALLVQRGKSAQYGVSNVQIIKSGQARGYNEFDFSKRYYVSDGFVSDERNLQKGDILINSTGVGTAGRVTLFDLDGDFVVDSHITIVRFDQSKILPKYALYALANIGFKSIEAMANGQSGQIELSLPTINGIKLPLPPITIQKDIVAKIEAIENEVQTLKSAIEDAELQKKAILDRYLK